MERGETSAVSQPGETFEMEERGNNAKKMKVVLCGAAALMGREVIGEALEAGHQVTAVVTDPSFCTVIHDNLTVALGSLFIKSTLDAIFPGHDAVIHVAGFPRKPPPVTGYSETIPNIIGAMRDASISRIIVRTPWFTDRKSANRAGFWAKWIIVPYYKHLLIDMRAMEMYIEENCQDMNYTVVRHPGVNKKKKTGNEILVSEDYFVKTDYPLNIRMSTIDVAAFIVKILESQEYKNKMIAMVAALPPDKEEVEGSGMNLFH